MTLPPVQAGSLAKIVEIADDPPAQLPSRFTAIQEPLVLYIARVPGSRDVFLTTMKPQQKVVTAQDIESSLYYVHVDSEKDAELLDSEDEADAGNLERVQENMGPFTAQECQNGAHRRKPVPPPRRPTQDLEVQNEASPQGIAPSTAPQVNTRLGRKPVGQGRGVEVDPMVSHQKLLGPRPMHDRLHSVDGTVLNDSSYRKNVDVRRWSEQPAPTRPPLPPRPYDQKQRDLEDAYQANTAYFNERPASMEERRRSMNSDSYDIFSEGQVGIGSSLTLIRRYNYLQSNVGRILASSQPGDPVNLDIIGAGYSKFNDNGSSNTNEMSFQEQEQAIYRCQLQTVGGTTRGNDNKRPELYGPPLSNKPGIRSSFQLHGRNNRNSTSSESFSNPQQSATKGYTFQSPWNGICDFVTGVAGRSLKCRHSHPSRYGQETGVSELRFNLPSSKTFTAAPKSLAPNIPRESKRSSIFSNHRRHDSFDSIESSAARHSQSSRVELEDRLDLSLGQEHAGGGFAGKQAKLGKLIIEPEGLQMLDLLVAANMALWWRVYDRMA